MMLVQLKKICQFFIPLMLVKIIKREREIKKEYLNKVVKKIELLMLGEL